MRRAGVILLIVLFGNASLPAQSSASLTIHFQFQFKGLPVDYSQIYSTAAGETVRFDRVRFYAGDFSAITADDRPPEPNPAVRTYSLIDSRDSTSWQVVLPQTGPDSVAGVRFTIGVDSVDQVRGARSGTLDPLKGMYWTWNSGYVAVKIEGTSAASPAAGRVVEYHLGGYRKPNAALISVELKLAEPINLPPRSHPDLIVPVDLDRFFPASFSIKNFPGIMTPGPGAKALLQQFKNCFLVPHLLKPGS